MKVITKALLITIGTISLVLGLIGIIVPLLPTTPLLLLAAACYIRGSQKLYNRLINSKYLGSYIRNYREKRAIPLGTKIGAIFTLWVTIAYSALLVVRIVWVKVLLLLIATGVTLHICQLKTLPAQDEATEEKPSASLLEPVD